MSGSLREFAPFRENLEHRMAASFTPRPSDVERCLAEIDRLEGNEPLKKPPCEFPLPDGRRCCECGSCQGYE